MNQISDFKKKKINPKRIYYNKYMATLVPYRALLLEVTINNCVVIKKKKKKKKRREITLRHDLETILKYCFLSVFIFFIFIFIFSIGIV